MSRGINPIELIKRYGHSQKFMNYLGINLRLLLDRTPIENYKHSRRI